MKKFRINLWSSPRNISTALMYSFAQRQDMTVVDEPLYAHYLTHTKTKAQHPETAEILASQENNGDIVVKDMLTQPYNTSHVLFKQMTHHLIKLEEHFLQDMKNVLLIRDPRRIIASYSKVIPNPTIEDIGVRKQTELLDYLKKNNALHAVVDARRLLLNPSKVLNSLCEKLDIPYTEKMLSWQAGARIEDGVWAAHWYSNVHKSTGFKTYVEKKVKLSDSLEKLAEQCAPYYKKLLQEAI